MSMSPTRPLTGRKVLGIALTAFGFILAANITMSWYAVRTFSGLVVPNSYVASQSFDKRRNAQAALGWEVGIAYADGVLRLGLTDGAGRTVRPEILEVTVGRPTSARDDRVLEMAEMPGGYAGGIDLSEGNWRVEIVALAEDGTGFHQSRALYVATQ